MGTCRSGSSAGDCAEATELALQKAKGDYAALQKRATEVAAVAQQQLNELKTRLQRATGENDVPRACRVSPPRRPRRCSSDQLVNAQLKALKQKLEQKEQIEEAIEGRSAKLTEVYKALESECQPELQRCKEGHGAAPSPPPQEVEAAAAAADVGAAHTASAAAAAASSSSSSSNSPASGASERASWTSDLRITLGAFAGGVAVGFMLVACGAMRRGNGASGRQQRWHCGAVDPEELGWLPETVGSDLGREMRSQALIAYMWEDVYMRESARREAHSHGRDGFNGVDIPCARPP